MYDVRTDREPPWSLSLLSRDGRLTDLVEAVLWCCDATSCREAEKACNLCCFVVSRVECLMVYGFRVCVSD